MCFRFCEIQSKDNKPKHNKPTSLAGLANLINAIKYVDSDGNESDSDSNESDSDSDDNDNSKDKWFPDFCKKLRQNKTMNKRMFKALWARIKNAEDLKQFAADTVEFELKDSFAKLMFEALRSGASTLTFH